MPDTGLNPAVPSAKMRKGPLKLPNRVLIVDDSADILEMLGIALHNDGCESTCAGTRDEAIEILNAGWIPDVILLDFHMPGMTIESFMTTLISSHSGHLPRVVLMSADPNADSIAKNLGIPEVLHKPFDLTKALLEIAPCAG